MDGINKHIRRQGTGTGLDEKEGGGGDTPGETGGSNDKAATVELFIGKPDPYVMCLSAMDVPCT